MCAAMFTLDGPRVLGSSCLATGAAVGWTVTRDKTPAKDGMRTPVMSRAVDNTAMPPIVRLQAHGACAGRTEYPLCTESMCDAKKNGISDNSYLCWGLDSDR